MQGDDPKNDSAPAPSRVRPASAVNDDLVGAQGAEPALDENGYPTDPIAEVAPGLFQADTTYSPIQLFYQGFDAVFDLCGINRGDGVTEEVYVAHPIDDVPWLTDPGAIDQLAAQATELLRAGAKVAVNCMSGLNRSGLLVGRTLIDLGHTPTQAVELVRRARGPHALSNRAFVRWLLIDCTPRSLAERAREPGSYDYTGPTPRSRSGIEPAP